MAYYDPLVAIWPTLTPGTTAQKLTQLNAMTVTGSIPTLTMTTGAAIFNCISWSEFKNLTSANQTIIMQMLAIPGNLQGGSASLFIAPFFGSVAATMPLTIAALTAMAKAIVTPWWQANGYRAPINDSDLIVAGNLT